MVLAEWIYPIYRLRWQIELFFKSIKSSLYADQITSGCVRSPLRWMNS
jgi:IS4 transposase